MRPMQLGTNLASTLASTKPNSDAMLMLWNDVLHQPPFRQEQTFAAKFNPARCPMLEQLMTLHQH